MSEGLFPSHSRRAASSWSTATNCYAGLLPGTTQTRRSGNRNILSQIYSPLVDKLFTVGEAKTRRKQQIAEYLVLDALINTDRHHENWGILRRREGDQWRGGVAPSFDHASSLGRELMDERRRMLLVQNHVDRYVEKGHGAVFWSSDERRGPSPLELVRKAVRVHHDLFRPALDKLRDLDPSGMAGLIDRIPESWISSSARDFAIAVLEYNTRQLRMI